MQSDWNIALSLAKVVVGTSIVYYPRIFKDNGIIPSSLALILIGGLSSGISLYSIILCSDKIKISSYEQLGKEIIGRKTKNTITASIFFIGLFSLIIYIDICSVVMKKLLGTDIGTSKIIFSVICGFLSIFCSTITKLNVLNYLGMTSIVFMLVTMMFLSYTNSSLDIDLNIAGYTEDLFNRIGLMSLCFCSHFVIIPIMNTLDEKYNKGSVIIYACILSVSIYIVAGIFGYLSFRDTKNNWLENDFKNNHIFYALSLIVILVNVLSFPLCMISSRAILCNFLGLASGNEAESVQIVFITLISCLSSYFITDYSYMYTSFLSFGSLIMYIYPSIFYFKVFGYKNIKMSILSGINGVIGGFLFCFSFIEFYSKIKKIA